MTLAAPAYTMKPLSLLLVLQSCFCFLVFATASYPSEGRGFYATVTKIIDGDSLKVRSGNKNIEVRLYGVDAPEYDQPFAAKSKKYVAKKLKGRNVTIVPVDTDRYGRLVAIVQKGDKTINEQLLAMGLAWYYPKYCKKAVCSSWKKTSKKARKQRKNIWSDPSPISPWRWKYEKHKNN